MRSHQITGCFSVTPFSSPECKKEFLVPQVREAGTCNVCGIHCQRRAQGARSVGEPVQNGVWWEETLPQGLIWGPTLPLPSPRGLQGCPTALSLQAPGWGEGKDQKVHTPPPLNSLASSWASGHSWSYGGGVSVLSQRSRISSQREGADLDHREESVCKAASAGHMATALH